MSPFRLTKAYWPLALPVIVLLLVSFPERMVYGASTSGQFPVPLVSSSAGAVPGPLARLIFLAFADKSPREVFLVGFSLALIVLSLFPLIKALFACKVSWFKRFTNLLKAGLHLLAGCSLFAIVTLSGVNRIYVASAFDEILEDLGLIHIQPAGESFGSSGPASKVLADRHGGQKASNADGRAAAEVGLLQGATCGTIAPQGAELFESSPPAESENSRLKFELGLEVH